MAEAQHSCDVVIVGGGPGGYVAAIRAAQLGMQVALVERDALGGICLNWGCIPTKALLRNAEVYHLMQHAADFGLYCDNLRFDFSKVIARSRQVAERLSRGVAFLMRKNKIQVFHGTGRLAGTGVVTVHDAQEALSATLRAPHVILIIGAGAIGVEFAYFYNAFGSKVTLIEMLPQILPVEDSEIAGLLHKSLEKQGIAIHTGSRVEHAGITADGVQVHMHTPAGAHTVQALKVLVAIGVQGNIENLGLETAGVRSERGFIPVDAHCRTNVPGIYAIGDVNGPPCLAHLASAEGIATVEAIAGLDNPGVNYGNIPGCTYCQPQVASVGLTEQAAHQAGRIIRVGRFPFLANGKALA